MSRHGLFHFDVQEQLPQSPSESKQYLENLRNLLGSQQQGSLFQHLYENLSILDAKSGSLLQFNSILVAVLTIFLTTIDPKLPAIAFYVAVAGILATLYSSYRLLEVVWVHWSTADHMQVSEGYELKLLEVRKERTVLYRIAWNFSKGAVLIVAILVLIVGWARVT